MLIYFLGIGGTAMGHAAILFKKMGHEVLGSDYELYPPMSLVLEKEGITYFNGFDDSRLSTINPDLVVIGNALSRGNVEVEWVLNHPKVQKIALPELISRYLLSDKKPIVVTGTHGKTTASSMIAHLLMQNELNPSWFIGGVPKSLPSGANLGKGEAFVIEGDEYDSAFFDKRSKFIHYKPFIATINNIEMDHADIFRDIIAVKQSFEHFIRLIPSNGVLIVNGDDSNIQSLLPINWCPVLTVGIDPSNDLYLSNYSENEGGSSFSLYYKGSYWSDVSLDLIGFFNARNAAIAALSAGMFYDSKQPTKLNIECLSSFKGVTRRQECLYRDPLIGIFEDFAHHPSSLKKIIRTFKNSHSDSRLVICFEPRSNTARSSLFQNEFTDALKKANFVKIAPVPKSKHVATESYLDTDRIVQELKSLTVEAKNYADNEDLKQSLIQLVIEARTMKQKTTIVFCTNGSFDGIIQQFVNELKGDSNS